MSSAIRGEAVSAANAQLARTPTASISRSALERNVDALAAAGCRDYPQSLLRADAWGHGENTVSEVLLARGLRLRPAGAAPADAGSADPRAVFGLPGAPGAFVPAMRVSGLVLSTKDLREGEGVSYGYTYRAPTDTRVALVTGGYAQGIVRALGNAAAVLVAARLCPIVGRVAMDVCVVEIADAAVSRGDEVLFFGDPARGEPGLAAWCEVTGMSAAELVAAVGVHAGRRLVA